MDYWIFLWIALVVLGVGVISFALTCFLFLGIANALVGVIGAAQPTEEK